MVMSPYTRGALFLLRMTGAGLIILSLIWLGLDLFLFLGHRPVESPLWMAAKSIPFFAGAILCWKSSSLAERLTRDFD